MLIRFQQLQSLLAMQLLLFCPRCTGDDGYPWNVSQGLQDCTGERKDVHRLFKNKLFDREMGQESGLSDES